MRIVGKLRHDENSPLLLRHDDTSRSRHQVYHALYGNSRRYALGGSASGKMNWKTRSLG